MRLTSPSPNARRARRILSAAGTALALATWPVAVADADTEVQWAQQQQSANPSNPSYTNECLAFVGDAANTAAIDFRSQINVPIGADTYPDDLLGHFTGGTWSTDTDPPAGAWRVWPPTW